ncbi:ankyrin repeat domain-containing protein 33B-like [Ptychodera flava]|uniref:ankyrin repeat domain-containing protein 33B-like n=1 Tax=Ptychodera flava TaxID=63121 RepID=UPI00396A1F5A
MDKEDESRLQDSVDHEDGGSQKSEERKDEQTRSAFLRACQDCDEKKLDELIKKGLSSDEVNICDRSGKTGFAYACSQGFLPVLRLVENMQNVIDVNQADNEGTTPLMFASQAGHWDVVNYLLVNYKNVEIDKRDNGGFTALIKAAIQGRNRSAKLLVLSGASTQLRDYRRGFCAAEWAEFCGRHACSSLIMRLTEQLETVRRCNDDKYRITWSRSSSDPDLSRVSFDATDFAHKPSKKCKKTSSFIKKGSKTRPKTAGTLLSNGKRKNEDKTISELVYASSCLSYSGLPSNATPPNSPLLSRIAAWATRTARKSDFVVPKVMVTKPADETGLSRRLNAILSPPSNRRRRPPRDPLAIGKPPESSSSDEDD